MVDIESRGLTKVITATGRVLLLAGWLWSVLGCSSKEAAKNPGEGPLAEAYKSKIELSHLGLAKGENYLGDSVHFVEGVIRNAGERVVQRVELTLLFRDSLNQVVLKETRRAFDYKGSKGLDPQRTSKFQIAFDHLPKDWNYALPEVQVSGVALK